jgi:hypothetical protein
MCVKNTENCPVPSKQQGRLNDEAVPLVLNPVLATVKVPVVIAERTLQVVVESDLPLFPAASEIKRIHKNAVLQQVKLVPVAFNPIAGTDFFNVTRAKLFVSGFIRKNIEYATANCNTPLADKIATVPFTGFAELTAGDFLTFPVLAPTPLAQQAQFLSETNQQAPRLDKFYFQNLVNYNEQPYGELVRANFYELDFSPLTARPGQAFNRLREKIVMDISFKVLQIQQLQVTANQVLPATTPGVLG